MSVSMETDLKIWNRNGNLGYFWHVRIVNQPHCRAFHIVSIHIPIWLLMFPLLQLKYMSARKKFSTRSHYYGDMTSRSIFAWISANLVHFQGYHHSKTWILPWDKMYQHSRDLPSKLCPNTRKYMCEIQKLSARGKKSIRVNLEDTILRFLLIYQFSETTKLHHLSSLPPGALFYLSKCRHVCLYLLTKVCLLIWNDI